MRVEGRSTTRWFIWDLADGFIVITLHATDATLGESREMFVGIGSESNRKAVN